ncbi:MAG TPA: hypothetical protein VM888_05950, partial [Chitinophagaceae bacterium]|nr:hypothetical protein [Chitinophagaceae bacterium]
MIYLKLFLLLLICTSCIGHEVNNKSIDELTELNDATTKGSIKGGSKVLQLQSSIGVKKGSTIIVEIGGEKDKGALGTVGVGGGWPNTRFVTETELLANRTQTISGIYAVAQNTGNVFRWNGKDAWVPFTTWHYYGSKGHSFALVEKVSDVSGDGRTLT